MTRPADIIQSRFVVVMFFPPKYHSALQIGSLQSVIASCLTKSFDKNCVFFIIEHLRIKRARQFLCRLKGCLIFLKNIDLGQFFVYFKLSAQFRKPMTHSNNKYHEKSVVDVLFGSNCCHRCSESSAIPLSYSGTLEVALFKWCNKCPVNFRNRLAFTCSIRIIALDRHVNCWNFSFNLLWYVQCG